MHCNVLWEDFMKNIFIFLNLSKILYIFYFLINDKKFNKNVAEFKF